jgi:hypothetical protein
MIPGSYILDQINTEISRFWVKYINLNNVDLIQSIEDPKKIQFKVPQEKRESWILMAFRL